MKTQSTSSRSFVPLEHQKLIRKFLRWRKQALVFAGCGLGKTGSCLSVLDELFMDCAIRGVLVVAPIRVANLTWPAEVEEWKEFSWMKVVSLRTPEGQDAFRKGEAHIYTINYESLPKILRLLLHGKRLKQWPIDMVIWDEVSKAKNPKSKRIRAAKYYLWRLERHWGLTGTPASNGLLDLFGQALLIDRGKSLGTSITAFKDRYFETVDYQGRKWEPMEHAKKSIYKKLKSVAISLRASDWLDVPELSEEDIELALPVVAKAQYAKLKKELLLLLASGSEVVAVNAAVLLNKLLQVTSGAVYVEGDKKTWEHIHDVKVKAAVKVVKEADGPVLVACYFKHEQERLAKAIPGAVLFSSAKTDVQQRELLARWNARKIPALIANPKSMAHGLNMQKGGSTVLWTTLPWSREDYDQTNGRLYRHGQEDAVKVIRLMMLETVDDAVAFALNKKRDEESALISALDAFRRMSGVRRAA